MGPCRAPSPTNAWFEVDDAQGTENDKPACPGRPAGDLPGRNAGTFEGRTAFLIETTAVTRARPRGQPVAP